MDIVISIYKQWSQMILSGEKPIEFRTKLPNDFKSGDKIYIYETARYGGARAIVGECVVDYIIPVLSSIKNNKWPIYGAYPFIDYYFEHIKGDKDIAEHYRKLKKEFDTYENYRYGFILNYAFCEEELESLRTTGSLIDTFKIFDYDLVKKIIDKNDIGNKRIEECDKWLSKIGYYNEFDETYYQYGIVLKDVIKYDTPIPTTEFLDRNGNPIQRAPQSWMYTRGRKEN